MSTKQRYCIDLPRDVHISLKSIAAVKEITMRIAIIDSIRDYIEKNHTDRQSNSLFRLVKDKNPIEKIIGNHTLLTQHGKYYRGVCPFEKRDKDPLSSHPLSNDMFSVSPFSDLFYCFGCSKGGDVISFVAEWEHCSQMEAAKNLLTKNLKGKGHGRDNSSKNPALKESA